MARAKTPHPADWFGWERPGIDFPLYNDESLPLWSAFLLMGSSLGIALLLQLAHTGSRVITCAVVLLGTLVPFLIASRGKVGCLFKKPQVGDIGLAVSTWLLYFGFTVAMTFVLEALGLPANDNPATKSTKDLVFWVSIVFQLFGEELIKINLFLGLLIVAYRLTHNRKLGIIVGTICCLTLFGLAHLATYGSLAQVLLIQGLGSIFHLFCYLKTKNILVGYASHLMTDTSFFLLDMLVSKAKS